MSQNGDIIFDAVDYEQTLYCVESSGETYSKENDEQQQQKPKRSLPLELHVPRWVKRMKSNVISGNQC